MRTNHLVSRVALAATILVLGLGPATAALDVDFLFNIRKVHDDGQLFLNLAVGNSGVARPAIEPVLPRLVSIHDDLPVALFLSLHSGRPLSVIVNMRSHENSWSAVFARMGVPPGALFAGFDRDPGPPYGKAWGAWHKHHRQTVITDADIVSLCQLQWASRITGQPVTAVAQSQHSGKAIFAAVADHHGRPYKSQKVSKAGMDDERQERGRGRGRGKAHGKGQAPIDE